MRLVDEIVTGSAYLDFGKSEQTEFVALSTEALTQIKIEIQKELNKEEVSDDDVEICLAMKYLVIPSSVGIDYKFFKEIHF